MLRKPVINKNCQHMYLTVQQAMLLAIKEDKMKCDFVCVSTTTPSEGYTYSAVQESSHKVENG